MRTRIFRSKTGAWWLLLLLVRVMAPEVAVLRLHAHEHTTDAAQAISCQAHSTHLEISEQHQHCHAEQLYNAAFQPALPPEAPQPTTGPVYADFRPLTAAHPARHLLPGTVLRGPPLA